MTRRTLPGVRRGAPWWVWLLFMAFPAAWLVGVFVIASVSINLVAQVLLAVGLAVPLAYIAARYGPQYGTFWDSRDSDGR